MTHLSHKIPWQVWQDMILDKKPESRAEIYQKYHKRLDHFFNCLVSTIDEFANTEMPKIRNAKPEHPNKVIEIFGSFAPNYIDTEGKKLFKDYECILSLGEIVGVCIMYKKYEQLHYLTNYYGTNIMKRMTYHHTPWVLAGLRRIYVEHLQLYWLLNIMCLLNKTDITYFSGHPKLYPDIGKRLMRMLDNLSSSNDSAGDHDTPIFRELEEKVRYKNLDIPYMQNTCKFLFEILYRFHAFIQVAMKEDPTRREINSDFDYINMGKEVIYEIFFPCPKYIGYCKDNAENTKKGTLAQYWEDNGYIEFTRIKRT